MIDLIVDLSGLRFEAAGSLEPLTKYQSGIAKVDASNRQLFGINTVMFDAEGNAEIVRIETAEEVKGISQQISYTVKKLTLLR